MNKKIALLILSVTFLSNFAPITVIDAHTKFVNSNPLLNSIISSVPKNISIELTEPIQIGTEFNEIYLSNNIRIDTRTTYVFLKITVIFTNLREIPNPYDIYTVLWYANSAVNGHFESNSFTFAIQYPNGTLPVQ